MGLIVRQMDNSRCDDGSYAVDIRPLNELYTLELNKNQSLLNLRSQADHSPAAGGNQNAKKNN